MKGLLLKDWYEIRYQYRWFLILLAVAGFSSATGQGNAVFWGCYMMILVAMIPLNTMGYDEKADGRNTAGASRFHPDIWYWKNICWV